MTQLFLKMAGFRIIMEADYDYVKRQCVAYFADFSLEDADFYVSASSESIDKEMAAAHNEGLDVSRGYAESICLYRELCKRLPQKDAMLMHAAVISDGEHAFAFTAPSGTGKSTHIRLWHEAFGDSIFVVNGDKPILRLIDGVWWVYGTPWCGKEGWHTNIGMPLSGICFLSRGEENSISRMPLANAVPMLMRQILIPKEPVAVGRQMQLLNALVTKIPLYTMACTISEDAARMARDAMKP